MPGIEEVSGRELFKEHNYMWYTNKSKINAGTEWVSEAKEKHQH